MTTTKHVGILFKPEMVRALLAGRKTQTRRTVKPQPKPEPARIKHYELIEGWPDFVCESNSGKVGIFEPFGYDCTINNQKVKVGNRLYVKETWYTEAKYDHLSPSKLPQDAQIWYSADGEESQGFGRVRQSIFMRRQFSRITLEIVSIRCERVQDISIDDAYAEGYQDKICGTCHGTGTHPYGDVCSCDGGYQIEQTPTLWYQELWSEINGMDSWGLNPWVWVIEFKVIDTKAGAK